jgi:hypothetical protein
MAVTRGATLSSFTASANGTTADISHTVDSGTTLLVVCVTLEAGESVVGTPQWSQGGGENLTLVNATTESGSNQDMRNYIYALVSPTSGAGTIDIVISTTDNVFSCAINYIGTDETDVATATNFLSEDVNNAGTSTCVHASAGSAGNALFFLGNFKGGDATPVSNNASFNELFEDVTGTSPTSDQTFYVADLLDSAPSAITVTWTGTDENAGNYIEIVAAAGDTTLTPAVGSISIAGQDVAMTTTLAPADGSLAIAGQNVALAFDTPITPAVGSISIAGQNVDVALNIILAPAAGSIVMAGQAVNLAFDTPITPGAGSLVMAGQAVTMTVTLAPGVGSLVMAGQAVTVVAAGTTTIVPAVGSLAINGQDVTMLLTLAPAVGALVMAGQNISLTVDAVLEPLVGSIIIAGQDVTVFTLTVITPAAGSIVIAGQSVNVVENRIITPTSAILTINGQPVDVIAAFAPGEEEQFVIRLVGPMVDILTKELT